MRWLFVWLWLWRFNGKAKRNGYRMICYNCYKVLAPPFAHTLEITDSLRTTILCVGCDDALLFKKKRKLYWMWFYALSGLPSDMWAVVQQRLEEEENGFGL